MRLNREICLCCQQRLMQVIDEDSRSSLETIGSDRIRQGRCIANENNGNPTFSNFGKWVTEVPRWCEFSAEQVVSQ